MPHTYTTHGDALSNGGSSDASCAHTTTTAATTTTTTAITPIRTTTTTTTPSLDVRACEPSIEPSKRDTHTRTAPPTTSDPLELLQQRATTKTTTPSIDSCEGDGKHAVSHKSTAPATRDRRSETPSDSPQEALQQAALTATAGPRDHPSETPSDSPQEAAVTTTTAPAGHSHHDTLQKPALSATTTTTTPAGSKTPSDSHQEPLQQAAFSATTTTTTPAEQSISRVDAILLKHLSPTTSHPRRVSEPPQQQQETQQHQLSLTPFSHAGRVTEQPQQARQTQQHQLSPTHLDPTGALSQQPQPLPETQQHQLSPTTPSHAVGEQHQPPPPPPETQQHQLSPTNTTSHHRRVSEHQPPQPPQETQQHQLSPTTTSSHHRRASDQQEMPPRTHTLLSESETLRKVIEERDCLLEALHVRDHQFSLLHMEADSMRKMFRASVRQLEQAKFSSESAETELLKKDLQQTRLQVKSLSELLHSSKGKAQAIGSENDQLRLQLKATQMKVKALAAENALLKDDFEGGSNVTITDDCTPLTDFVGRASLSEQRGRSMSTSSPLTKAPSVQEYRDLASNYTSLLQEHQALKLEFAELQKLQSESTTAKYSKMFVGQLSPNSPPLWVRSGNCDNCMECGSLFTLLFRRHHCRRCGRVLCQDCSSVKAPLPEFGQARDPKGRAFSSPVRVCVQCHNRSTE